MSTVPPESSAATGSSEKVLTTAQHIVKSLANSKNATEDMIHILSGFNNHLSSITADLFPSPDLTPFHSLKIPSVATFNATEQLILLWDATSEALVFKTPEDDIARYLAADHLVYGSATSWSTTLCRSIP